MFWDLLYLFVWSIIHSIRICFSQGEKCVDLVIIFNKRRKVAFAVSLQNRKTCVCIKYLKFGSTTTVNCREFYFFYTRCKMHIAPVLLKNYLFHNFSNRSNFTSVCFFSKKIFSLQKMFMLCLWLRHGTYLNSTSNVFTCICWSFS